MLKVRLADSGRFRVEINKSFALILMLLSLLSGAIYFIISFAGTILLYAPVTFAALGGPNATTFDANLTANAGTIENNTEIFTNIPNITVYTNSSVANVTLFFGNGSSIILINATTQNLTWTNSTPIAFGSCGSNISSAGRVCFRNFTVRANGTAGSSQELWSNRSSSEVLLNFSINEVSPNSTNFTEAGGLRGLVNGSIYGTDKVWLNITLNGTLSTCNAVYGNGSTIVLGNQSGIRTSYGNTSANSVNDTFFVLPSRPSFNVTYSCQDAFGNTSWMNSTQTSNYVTGKNYTFFRVDTVAPTFSSDVLEAINNVTVGQNRTFTVDNETITFSTNNTYQTVSQFSSLSWTGFVGTPLIRNATFALGAPSFGMDAVNGRIRIFTNATLSTGDFNVTYSFSNRQVDAFVLGNYLNISVQSYDLNPATVYVSVILNDTNSNLTTVNGSSKNTSSDNAYFEVNVSGNHTKADGLYQLELTALDQAGNARTFTTRNLTYVSTRLTAGWNIISWYENMTLGQVLSWHPNITQASIFDARTCCKNFTTATTSVTTNRVIVLNGTLNVTYVFSNDNITLIRPYKESTAGSFRTSNITLFGGWNLISVENRGVDLNRTMYAGNSFYNESYRVNVTNTSVLTSDSLTRLGEGFGVDRGFMFAGNTSVLAVSSPYNGTIPTSLYSVNSTHVSFRLNSSYPVNETGGVAAVGGNWAFNYNWTYNFTVGNGGNVTYSSFYNNTLKLFCTGRRAFSSGMNSCFSQGYISSNITVPKGWGIWILTPLNITVNRTAIGGA